MFFVISHAEYVQVADLRSYRKPEHLVTRSTRPAIEAGLSVQIEMKLYGFGSGEIHC